MIPIGTISYIFSWNFFTREKATEFFCSTEKTTKIFVAANKHLIDDGQEVVNKYLDLNKSSRLIKNVSDMSDSYLKKVMIILGSVYKHMIAHFIEVEF